MIISKVFCFFPCRQTVQNDMTIWERSGQWPLSCYTFTKEEPCFQGKSANTKCYVTAGLTWIHLILLAGVFKSSPSETAEIGPCRFYGLSTLLTCALIYFTCLGLLDFSPEEIRLEAYTANAKGSADGYVRINTLYCIIVNSIFTREKKNRSSAAWYGLWLLEIVFQFMVLFNLLYANCGRISSVRQSRAWLQNQEVVGSISGAGWRLRVSK